MSPIKKTKPKAKPKTKPKVRHVLPELAQLRKAASAASAASPTGQAQSMPYGARSFDCRLRAGTGKVVMNSLVAGDHRILLRLPAPVVARLKAASEGRRWSSAMVALAMWALDELERTKKDMDVRAGDP